jgi:hypothetical protein
MAGKTRSVTNGSGGSGDPTIRDKVHGVRVSIPTFNESAAELLSVAGESNQTISKVPTSRVARTVV